MKVRPKRPEVPQGDLLVWILAKFMRMMWPVVIFGTLLVICVAVYAVAWGFKK